MNDGTVLDRIEKLVEKEKELLGSRAGAGPDAEEHRQLEEVKVELDRCWDLLRQRRAHEEFGLDPDQTSTRDSDTVEGYLQ